MKMKLHEAADKGDVAEIRKLIKGGFFTKGLAVDGQNEYGSTALHFAAGSGHIDAIQCLVKEFGANVNATNIHGTTPLHSAAWDGHIDAIRYLVKKCGADVNICDKEGKMPYEAAHNITIKESLKWLTADYKNKNNLSKEVKNENTSISKSTAIEKKTVPAVEAVSLAPIQPNTNTPSNENENQNIQKQTIPSPKDALQALLKKGQTLLQQKKYIEAETCFDEALLLDENDIESWQGKGTALLFQAVLNQALDCFNQVLLLQPSHFEACIAKAKLLLQQGKEQDAVQCYDSFLKQTPHHLDAFKAKMALLANQNNKQAVLDGYDEFLKHNPDNLDLFKEKIALLLEQGNVSAALHCLDEKIKQEPSEKTFYEWKGSLLSYAKRYQEVVTHYTRALEIYTNDETFTNLLSNNYVQQKQIIKAELLINKVLKQNPLSALALQSKAFVELNKNRKESAQSYFAQAEQAAEGNHELLARLYYERGQVYQAWNSLTEAKTYYEKVLQQEKAHPFAKLCLAELSLSLNQIAETKVSFVSAPIESVSNNNNDSNNLLTSPHIVKTTTPSFSITYSQIKIGKELGNGGFGRVYQGVWSDIDVAIKQLKNGILTSNTIEAFNHEVELMAGLRHKHIVQLYGAVTEKEPYCMVMEYMDGGSLYDLLQKPIPLSWPQRETMALDIAKGLNYLHEHNILHRDLKSLNVLLDEHHTAKLADFGLAKIKADTSHTTQTHGSVAGSFAWMAPELFSNEKCTKASDMWSYGMVVWEITSRNLPFKNATAPYIMTCVLTKEEPESIPQDCKQQFPKLAHLIQFCWQKEKANRLSAAQAIEHLQKSPVDLVSHDSDYEQVQSFRQTKQQEENSYRQVKSFGG